jgi:hypothetical protein
MLYMPLDVQRLLDSDLFITCTGDEFKAAVALWCKSWSQIPAASLPDDDRILADYSRAGSKWKKVRDAAMRGWFKASDGRLYHPVVAEKARDAWESRLAQRARTEAARAARASSNRNHKQPTTDTVTEPVTDTVTEQPQRPSKVNGIVKGIDTAAAPAEPCRPAAATADPLDMDSMQAAPPTPQRANFADWRIMVGKRCFVGREERSEWEALFHAEGWDAMTSAYEFLTNQNPEPSKLFLSSFQEIRA